MTETHSPKFETEHKSGKATLYGVACSCGWQSALHESRHLATVAFREHKEAHRDPR